MTEQTEKPAFEGWCRLSILGHVEHMGYVSGAPMFGATMVQIQTVDRYTGEQGKTLYYSPTSIYSLEPISEEEMRANIERVRDEVRRRDEMLAARQLRPAVVVHEELGAVIRVPNVEDGDDPYDYNDEEHR